MSGDGNLHTVALEERVDWMDRYKICWRRANDLSTTEFEECAALFSRHYGKWGQAAGKDQIGNWIKLPTSKLREYLGAPTSWAALAYIDNTLVGYAFAQWLPTRRKGNVTWVTQFVVHVDHRRRGLGTRLLRAIWSQSDQHAWGLVTANPFAVRALEKATLRSCNPERIRAGWPELYEVAKPYLSYVSNAPNMLGSSSTALNTNFPLDHFDSDNALRALESNGYKWQLGGLGKADEWAAFTFQDQDYASDAHRLLVDWVADCDRTVRDAYDGMAIDDNHKWAQHTAHEIEVFLARAKPDPGASILDVGCGFGRHSIGLAARGYKIVGIDFVLRFVDIAIGKANSAGLGDRAKFVCGDIRTSSFDSEFDHAICLYDVIGSFAADHDNYAVIQHVYRKLKPGGTLLASVINGELTSAKAIHRASSTELPKRLLDIKPSRIMQETGNIFDPRYYLWEEDTGVAYRKEQFASATIPPCELIVRDRRYSADAITMACRDAGFEVHAVIYVQAGKWNKPLEPLDENAKEILLFCQKPEAST